MHAVQNLFLCAGYACVVLSSSSFAQERPGPSEVIHYEDIGKRFYIEGDFGKLYSDFTIRGVVLKPIGKGDTGGKVRLEITHVRGKGLEQRRDEYIVTESQFAVGSNVELLVREQARFWYPEGIEDVISNPSTGHFHKLHCVVSLHLRKVVSVSPPAKESAPPGPERGVNQDVVPSKESQKDPGQGGRDQPTTAPESNSGKGDNPFKPKSSDLK